jgi:phosphomannomutase
MSTESNIETLVNEWLSVDKNIKTCDEIRSLWAKKDTNELEKRLRKRIEFGTAGLRGRMEAGFSRMNDLTIIQASQGLATYMLQQVNNPQERGVVVGHDHRYNSERWARLTAAAFVAKGFKVYLHRGIVHTPLVPFSVSKLKAAGGVMITASHNPKNDNGYKVYWENAIQIIAPHDEGIAKAITENLKPESWDTDGVINSPLCLDKTEEMKDAYFATLKTLSVSSASNSSCSAKFVNTSMHGAGHAPAERVFATFGLPPFVPVVEQKDPDPEFPTVKFPNPEEKGALDLAIKTANACGASHILAQDPDADRFSTGEKQPDGSWTVFSGDQIGALLAAWIFDGYKSSGKPIEKLAMCASTVSSKLIESMAKAEGFRFVETLTGFKFIGNTAAVIEQEGYDVPFGYEEAIGFMLGHEVRDKDGIAATAVFAELVASLSQRGLTVSGYLNSLYERYGYFQTSNSYFVCNDPPTIDRIFARLRQYRGSGDRSYPETIGGLVITQVRDLTNTVGYDSSNPPSFKPQLPLSAGYMVTVRAQEKDIPTDDACSIVLTIRTSGTEPKIKYYLEGKGKDRRRVGEILTQVVSELRDQWMEATANSLTEP